MPKNSKGEEIPEKGSKEWNEVIESQKRWNPRHMRSLFGGPRGRLVPDPFASKV